MTSLPSAADGGLVIGIIDGGKWSAAFGLRLGDIRIYDAVNECRLLREGAGILRKRAPSGGIADGRNSIVDSFLDSLSAEWLLMLDSDMSFEPSIAEQLIATADAATLPVVGALCFSLSGATPGGMLAERFEITPTIYAWAGIEDAAERGFSAAQTWEKDAVVPCDGTGAAALLVHRDVLVAARESCSGTATGPFDRLTVPGIGPKGAPRIFSEDLSFCIRLGALGVPIAVDTSVKTTHDKDGIWLDEETYRATRGEL